MEYMPVSGLSGPQLALHSNLLLVITCFNLSALSAASRLVRFGENYTRDEDHLARVIELLGKIPRRIAMFGIHSCQFFNWKSYLRNIAGLKRWRLF
jgi:hypothetical protein